MKSIIGFHVLAGTVSHRLALLFALLMDGLQYLALCLRPTAAVAAENLFLRKQLALYQERQIKPRRTNAAIRLTMVWLARWFDWKAALSIVNPQTFTRWHQQGFRLFWSWKSQAGRPILPKALQAPDPAHGGWQSQLGATAHRQ